MNKLVIIQIMICLVLLTSCIGKDRSSTEPVTDMDSNYTLINDKGISEVVADEYYITEKEYEKEKYKKESDSIKNLFSQPQDTILAEGEPDLTKLPINTHELFMSNRMDDFTYMSHDLYYLPPATKMSYIPIYGYYRKRMSKECLSFDKMSNIEIDSLYDFTTYRYILPVIFNYKAYIVSNHGSYYRDEMLDNLISCHAFVHPTSAYLLLYDTISNTLNFIELFCWSSSQGFAGRTFDIDENFVITLKDYRLDVDYDIEDENGNPFAEYRVINTFKVYILNNGSIKVDYPKMYGFKYEDIETAWGVRDSIDSMTIIYQINGEIDTLSKI